MKIHLLLSQEAVTEELLNNLVAPDVTSVPIRECVACGNKTWVVFPSNPMIECACCGASEEFDP